MSAGWAARFAARLGDARGAAVHSVTSMIRQRVYGILAGYEDCNDHDTLRDDPAFKMIDLTAGQGVEQVRRKHRGTLPRRVTIDLDSTDDPAHGQHQ